MLAVFEPPFDFEQRVHVRTEVLFRTVAATGIQIHPALGTQTFAVYRAQRLHRKGQQNLLAQNIADRQLRSCEERSPCVAFAQFDLCILIEHLFVALTEEKMGVMQSSGPKEVASRKQLADVT